MHPLLGSIRTARIHTSETHTHRRADRSATKKNKGAAHGCFVESQRFDSTAVIALWANILGGTIMHSLGQKRAVERKPGRCPTPQRKTERDQKRCSTKILNHLVSALFPLSRFAALEPSNSTSQEREDTRAPSSMRPSHGCCSGARPATTCNRLMASCRVVASRRTYQGKNQSTQESDRLWLCPGPDS